MTRTSACARRGPEIGKLQVGYSTTEERQPMWMPQSEYRKALEHTFAPEFSTVSTTSCSSASLEIGDGNGIVDLELQVDGTKMGNQGRRSPTGPNAGWRPWAKNRAQWRPIARRGTLMDNVEEPLSALIIDGNSTKATIPLS